MSRVIDMVHPDHPKRILLVASNPTISTQTGWPIGFWAAELTHPYATFMASGYAITIASPLGGDLRIDGESDPDGPSGYADEDLLSKGFLSLPHFASQLHGTPRLATCDPARYDALLLVGGYGPMYTFFTDTALHAYVAAFYEQGKVTCLLGHATCILLKVHLSTGQLLIAGKTWTGFANAEEEDMDAFTGVKGQPFWIETLAKQIPFTNFIVQSPFKAHAQRDGNLITGQQHYSGIAAAQLVVAALGS